MRQLRLFAILALLVSVFILKDRFFGLREIENLAEHIQGLEKYISTPDPLRSVHDSPEAFLTGPCIIKFTNLERQKNALPVLIGNAKLNEAAAKKVQDMFSKQYFAHVSPEGRQASDLAADARYEYIAIGENLALGNFENDKVLVAAWMDSPGHRANILDKRFQDIGAATVKGIFEGKTTWLAVQIFGLSKSACPAPSEDLKTRIDNNEKTLEQMQAGLANLKKEIEGSSWSRSRRDEYNEKVKQYNDLVAKYNSVLDMTKNMITLYNTQVAAFNSCVKR